MLSESLPLYEKKFSSNRYSITLKFYPNGGITGNLYPYIELPSICQKVTGLYLTINATTTGVCLFCTFRNPNLESEAEIYFVGEIIKNDNDDECLVIKSFMSQNLFCLKMIDSDFEILVDRMVDQTKFC